MRALRFAGAGIAIFSLALFFVRAQPPGNQDVRKNSDGTDCGLTGTAATPDGKTLDKQKNRYDTPTPGDIDSAVTLASLLAPGDDIDRFNGVAAAKLVGFVVNVKVGGVETCNCKATATIDRDTHIELALSADAPSIQRAIVEVTPRIRDQKKAAGVDWTTETLRKTTGHGGIKGRWIEVTGWMTFDSMHINEAENTNPGGTKNWRATCWEIHPITDIKVLPGPPADTPEFHAGLMSSFHHAHALALERNPARKQELEARNKKIIERFSKEELDEDK